MKELIFLTLDEIRSLNFPLYIEQIDRLRSSEKRSSDWLNAFYLNVQRCYGITLEQARTLVKQLNP